MIWYIIGGILVVFFVYSIYRQRDFLKLVFVSSMNQGQAMREKAINELSKKKNKEK